MKIEDLPVTELKSKLQNIWRKHEKLCRASMGEHLYWLRKKMRAQGARNPHHSPVGTFGDSRPTGLPRWYTGSLCGRPEKKISWSKKLVVFKTNSGALSL
jgi:hypothetical protein